MTDPNGSKKKDFFNQLFSSGPSAPPPPGDPQSPPAGASSSTRGQHPPLSGTSAAPPQTQGPQFPPPRSGATPPQQSTAPPVSADETHHGKFTLEDCPNCHTRIVNPNLAIVCQNCQKFVVKPRVWHGAVAVLAIIVAIVLQDQNANSVDPVIAGLTPMVVGLLTAQILLLVAVRSLERRLLLVIVSLCLVPASLSIVALVVSLPLPRVFRTSATWIGVLCFLGLSIELFIHWREAGKRRGLSLWRILGTFSVTISAGALLLVAMLNLLPESFIPTNDELWPYVQHLLTFRAGMVLLWFAWVVILALPPAFGRHIAITPDRRRTAIATWVVYLGRRIGRVLYNLGRELADSFAEIIALARSALAPVVRRVLFLLSVSSLQIALCLAIDSYLRYMVSREVHLLQFGIAVFLAALAPMGFFWSAAKIPLTEVLDLTFNTVSMVGVLLFLYASIASWPWYAFELFSNRKVAPNWFVFLSGGVVVVAFFAALAGKDDHDKQQPG